MGLPIDNLGIDGYRGFSGFSAGPFGRVNLITGKNNAGKSSLLEAVRVFASGASQATLDSIVLNREEADTYFKFAPDVPEPGFVSTGLFPYSGLFTGFPDLENCKRPIVIANSIGYQESEALRIQLKWVAKEDSPVPGPAFPHLEIEFRGQARLLPILDRLQTRFSEQIDGHVFLDPAGSRSTLQQARWWDGIALFEEETKVIEALRIVAPDIEAVRVVGRPSGVRAAIARSRRHSHPVPLKSFGDGVNRIFGITLSLARAKSSVLVIDEFENGLHHSILPEVWKVVFHMATALGVQVFATTHSWDCITSFQETANEHPEMGVLLRLSVRNGEILPTIFREDELRIAARDQIELR
jgi:hypothetical protein